MAFSALYDACILHPAPLRDLFMHLALRGLYRARWTNQIHEEWIGSVLRTRSDLTRERLERTRQLMDSHAGDALIEGFEELIPTLSLPDLDDRHVLAAAIHGRVDVIVTYNLKDFPDAVLRHHHMEAQHPDVFLTHLLDLSLGTVLATLKRLRQGLKHPPVSAGDYLTTLDGLGLSSFVAELKEFQDVI